MLLCCGRCPLTVVGGRAPLPETSDNAKINCCFGYSKGVKIFDSRSSVPLGHKRGFCTEFIAFVVYLWSTISGEEKCTTDHNADHNPNIILRFITPNCLIYHTIFFTS